MSFSRESYLKEAEAQHRSPEFIEVTLAYADRLSAQDMPVIFSAKHLALVFELKLYELRDIADFRGRFYTFYSIRKRRGGVRQLSVPFSNVKKIQAWLHKMILVKIPLEEAAMGFRSGRSIKQNATPHAGKKFVLNIDLLKFFDSITEYQVYKVFANAGYAENLALEMAKICTVPLSIDYYASFSAKEQVLFKRNFERQIGVLPQGAPSSPALANIIASGLDVKLSELAKSKGCTFTRYADDITFSTDAYEQLPKFKELTGIIREAGFFVNWEKAKIFKSGQRQLVTGLTITHGVNVPKNYRKDVARHIHFCLKFGPEAHLLKIGNKEKKFYKDWLEGRILYISSINPNAGKKLLSDFHRIKWPF